MTIQPMNFKELNLAIFEGKTTSHVLFQPRFEPWFHWHSIFNQMPAEYEGMTIRDLYDRLGVSMRYMHYYTGVPDPVEQTYTSDVKIRDNYEGDNAYRIYDTPYGELTEKLKYTIDHEWRQVEFPAKSVEDLKALRWLIERIRYHFDIDKYRMGEEYVGERGIAQFWLPKSPYQASAQVWMKLQHLVYALADAPDEIEATLKVIDESYDSLYEQVCTAGAVKIINIGENLHEALFSHRWFERYYLPWYEKRANQLKRAGIYSHIHIDGYFHSLLKYLKDLPFDGLEALTPLPQGDVSLDEIKDAIGNKILLDGIPAVMFMDSYTRDELMEITEKVIHLFSPRLILGVSDEVPEGTDIEAMERVRLVADYCRTHPIKGSTP